MFKIELPFNQNTIRAAFVVSCRYTVLQRRVTSCLLQPTQTHLSEQREDSIEQETALLIVSGAVASTVISLLYLAKVIVWLTDIRL